MRLGRATVTAATNARPGRQPRVIVVTPHADWVQGLRATLEAGAGPLGADTVAQHWPDDGAVATGSFVRSMAVAGTELVLLGPGVGLDDAVALANMIDADHPEITTLLLAPRTAHSLDQALRAGVRGVVDPSTEGVQLAGVITEVLDVARARRTRILGNTTSAATDPNRLITVLAAKGGVGKTMLSTNLAVALARQFPGEVVLVDTDLQFGDVATSLGVEPERTISDTLALSSRLDATTLKAFLTPRPSAGVYALCAPLMPVDADDLTPDHVGRILDLLHQEFRFVVVDTTAGIDEMALQAIDRSTDLVVLTSTDVPSIRAAAKEIQALEMLGAGHLRWHLVLNRADARVGLNIDDIEATLGRSIDHRIPSSRALPLSVNHGVPLVESDPKSQPSRVIVHLAGHLAGVTSPAQSSKSRKDR